MLAVLLAGAVAGWIVLFRVMYLRARPAEVRPGPPTQDFGGAEPPALVSVLVNRLTPTADAAESTLLDLAARGYLELRQPGDNPLVTTVHPGTGRDRDGKLSGHERLMLHRVEALLANGPIPVNALAFTTAGDATAWAKRFHAEVIAELRLRGLSERRFCAALVWTMTAATIAVTALALAAGGPRGALFTLFALGIATLVLGHDRFFPERYTPDGRAATARWLSLRSFLRSHEGFTDLPPASVIVWNRYLSYGDALGTTHLCAAVLDLGLADRRRIWSSYGGRWRRVRVHYPTLGARRGLPTVRVAIFGVVGAIMLAGAGAFRPSAHGFPSAGVVLAAAASGYAGFLLIVALVDRLAPARVTGQVLRVGRSGLVIDTGRRDRTTAWGVPDEFRGRFGPGSVVTVRARRWSRRILDLRAEGRPAMTVPDLPLPAPLTPRLVRGAGVADPMDGEGLIYAAMAGDAQPPSPANAARGPAFTAAWLLTLDEISRALGAPATYSWRTQGSLWPTTTWDQYRTQPGYPPAELRITVSGRPAWRLAMRKRAGLTPLPGIGDEAYAGIGFVIGRCGDRVVRLRASPAGRVDPRQLGRLLATAVGRLPAVPGVASSR